jgi:hypothetical protein
MDQAQKGFDLENLDADTGPAVYKVSVIDDDDGNPQSGFIIVGKNSEQYQEAVKKIRIRNIKRAAKRKSQLDSSTDAGAEMIARTVDESDRETAMAVVIGWFGFHKSGEPMSFNREVVARMFKKYPQWQAKVLSELEVDANFTKA